MLQLSYSILYSTLWLGQGASTWFALLDHGWGMPPMEIPGGIKMGHLQRGFIRQWGSSELATSYIPSYKGRIELSFWGGCYALLSGVLLFVTPWTEEPGGLQSPGFSRQEILERAALSFCRRSLPPRLLGLLHWQADSLPLSQLGNALQNINLM